MAQRTTTVASAREAEEVAALDQVAETLEENARDERRLARHVRQLRNGRAAGRSWHKLLDRDGVSRLLDVPSRIVRRATEVSAQLRRRLASGLRAEGATLPAIAQRFGVTHQRISTLLRNGDRRPRSR